MGIGRWKRGSELRAHTYAVLLLSHVSRFRLLATPWTAAYQAPLSMGFSRQEYWSGVPLPSLAHIYLEKEMAIHSSNLNK